MLDIPLNKTDIYEIHVAHWLALIHSTCSSTYNLNSKLPTQTHQLHYPASRTSFSDMDVMQQNSSYIETKQRYICRIFYLKSSKFNTGRPT